MNLTKNDRFRLSKATFGVRLEDGKPTSTTTIPANSVIGIVSDVENSPRMIEVDWHGVRVLLFTEDIHERGRLVNGSRARASRA